MAIPTVVLSIRLAEIVGTALPNAQVVMTLTREDIVAGVGGSLVPVGRTIIACDADGLGSGPIFPNALGTQGTQYSVQVFNDKGKQVFPAKEKEVARAAIPNSACLLHEVLFNIPPVSQADADAAVIDARASKTSAAASAQAAAASASAADESEEQAEIAAAQALLLAPHFGPTPPTSPLPGKEWFNTTNGKRYTWYDDGTSAQWVEAGSLAMVQIPAAFFDGGAPDSVYDISLPTFDGGSP